MLLSNSGPKTLQTVASTDDLNNNGDSLKIYLSKCYINIDTANYLTHKFTNNYIPLAYLTITLSIERYARLNFHNKQK